MVEVVPQEQETTKPKTPTVNKSGLMNLLVQVLLGPNPRLLPPVPTTHAPLKLSARLPNLSKAHMLAMHSRQSHHPLTHIPSLKPMVPPPPSHHNCGLLPLPNPPLSPSHHQISKPPDHPATHRWPKLMPPTNRIPCLFLLPPALQILNDEAAMMTVFGP